MKSADFSLGVVHFISIFKQAFADWLSDKLLRAFQISRRTMWRHELSQRRRLLEPVQERAVVQLRRYVTIISERNILLNSIQLNRNTLSARKHIAADWCFASVAFSGMAHYVCALLMSVPAGCPAINFTVWACHQRYTVSYNDKVWRAGKVLSNYLFIVRNLLGACDVNGAL